MFIISAICDVIFWDSYTILSCTCAANYVYEISKFSERHKTFKRLLQLKYYNSNTVILLKDLVELFV